MQDIDNNMDDLFRKAVDNYTLQAGESSWDIIVSQLSDDLATASAENNHIKGTVTNGIILLAFLLIPLSTAMLSFYNTGNALMRAGNSAYHLNILPQQQVNSITLSRPSGQTSSIKLAVNKIEANGTSAPFYTNEMHTNTPVITQAGAEEKASKNNTAAVDLSVNSNKLPEAVASNQQKVTADKQPITITAHSPQKPYLYAGITTGFAFNEVKNQGFRKPGFDIGVIAGYSVNKNISLEIGLVYSRKYYFSDGKYFSMDKMSGSMPADMKVLSLQGSSNLYQVPVAIKYDIVHRKASNFFSTAGISSYILTKEKNDYQTSVNGVQQSMKGMYKNVSAGLASSIDMSIGYEHTIRKGADIRIQPYLQIPLKGMGMGSMQVLSAGMHIVYILPDSNR